MLSLRKILPVLLILFTVDAFAANAHIGYLYPAGAKQGTTVKITVGGQLLRDPKKIHISGEGVTGSVIQYSRQPFNFNGDQRKLIEEKLQEVKEKRLSELSGKAASKSNRSIRETRRKAAEEKKKLEMDGSQETIKDDSKEKKEAAPMVTMPNLPLLLDLEDKSIAEIEHIKNILFMPRRMKQSNRQISELVLIELTIAPNAEPGDRQLRIETRNSLSNPVIFQIGTLPEISELEPNGDTLYIDQRSMLKTAAKPKPNTITPPVTVNGQIMPGDFDRFVFQAKKDQKLVIETHARSLIPYLADAVPGWFQATIALFDEGGNELAFTDDYGSSPDPVMFFNVPADGKYELHIKDSLYRGREDFIYRISIGQTPFITSTFPLGAKMGSDTRINIEGLNLPEKSLPINTGPSERRIRKTAFYKDTLFSNSVSYVIGTLPESLEKDSNNTIKTAQPVTMPMIINGKIEESGDTDIFSIQAKVGDTIVAEVYARRLNSQIDSLLKLTDASGKTIKFNDDHVYKEAHLHKDVVGTVTHHADSYLSAKIPKDGTYYVQIEDANRQGGKNFAYRLRISKPIPSFELKTSISGIYAKPRGIIPITIHAMRKDGFDGPIDIVVKDPSTGFTIQGGTIPSGASLARITVTAPTKPPAGPVDLQLLGKAVVAGITITQPVIPADDVMQAFLYRHLLESQDLMIVFKKQKWPESTLELISESPLNISGSEPAAVRMKTPRKMKPEEFTLKLNAPPEGLTVSDFQLEKGGYKFKLTAGKQLLEKGFCGNIIVEAFKKYIPKSEQGKQNPKTRTYSVGFLPAIPIKIAQKTTAAGNCPPPILASQITQLLRQRNVRAEAVLAIP